MEERQLPIESSLKAQLFASYTRAIAGMACFYGALLWLPYHKVTPILLGVSVMMIVMSSHNAWRAGNEDRRLKSWSSALIWANIGLFFLGVALTSYFGFGAFLSPGK